jgi:predicted aconitase
MRLTKIEQEMAAGARGSASAFAMEILLRYAEAVGAEELIEITQAHVDGCLYHGQVSLDFVELLVGKEGRVAVPTTLNVGSMDLLHPHLIRAPAAERSAGRRLMEGHLALGCEPSFTCAPYQTRFRPRFGDQIAWAESNAIVFANSVIGARTNRYGDFIDLCCAMTGRAPACGLHIAANRLGEVLFRLPSSPATESLFVAVGALVGEKSAGRIPVIEGLPPPESEDWLKALGAVAASTGSIALFHAVGITPEAPTLGEAMGGRAPSDVVDVTRADLAAALAKLSTAREGDRLAAVSLGTPHFSLLEFEALASRLVGFRIAPHVELYVNTSRETLAAITGSGLLSRLQAGGATVVADTCVYVTSILADLKGVVMTNSGKMAHYAPGNLGVDVAFGSLDECLASASAGRVVRLGLE